MIHVIYNRIREIDLNHWWHLALQRNIATLAAVQITEHGDRRPPAVGCSTGTEIPLLGIFGVVDALGSNYEACDIAARVAAKARARGCRYRAAEGGIQYSGKGDLQTRATLDRTGKDASAASLAFLAGSS